MYKTLIVDDEAFVRESIVSKIQWEALGFHIVGEAENGIDALDVLEKEEVELVITDIKMPFMDGLSLAEKIGSLYPTTKIILLTGFDEFEYAKKAIKLNVFDYVLKPIASVEFTQLLQSVKTKLDEEYDKKKNIGLLKEQFKKYQPIVKEKFFIGLITKNMMEEEITQQANQLHIQLQSALTGVSVIFINGKQVKETSGFNMPQDMELLKFAVHNIVRDVLAKSLQHKDISFIYENKVVILHKLSSNSRGAILSTLAILEEIVKNIMSYLKVKVSIGVGSFTESWTKLTTSYKQALKASDYKLVMGDAGVYYIEDVEPKEVRRAHFLEEDKRQLSYVLKFGTKEQLWQYMDKYLSIFDEKTLFLDYQMYMMSLITTILDIARNNKLQLESLLEGEKNLFLKLNEVRELGVIRQWLESLCFTIQCKINDERKLSARYLIDQALDYIQKNYAQQELTVESICQYLHISSTYFNTIFKKETGSTCLKYVTKVRMERAKEMLLSTELKAYQIACEVGFADSNYFSYSFKKNVGMSPLKYRSNNNEKSV